MPDARRQNRQQTGGLIKRVNYGELTIILALLLSLAGMTTCAIGLKIEQRVQRDAFISKRNIFIPLIVIWAVSQATFIVAVCIHLARMPSVRYQSCGPSHAVPNYILRTVGLVLLTTILHLTISSFSAEGNAADMCSWIPLFFCASAVGNAIVGNGTESNLLAPNLPQDRDDGDEEAPAQAPAQQHSHHHGPLRQNAPPAQPSSSQPQQHQQDPGAGSSSQGPMGFLFNNVAGSFAQGLGGDVGQGISS